VAGFGVTTGAATFGAILIGFLTGIAGIADFG